MRILKHWWQLQRGQRGWEGEGQVWRGRDILGYQRQTGMRGTNSKSSFSWLGRSEGGQHWSNQG